MLLRFTIWITLHRNLHLRKYMLERWSDWLPFTKINIKFFSDAYVLNLKIEGENRWKSNLHMIQVGSSSISLRLGGVSRPTERFLQVIKFPALMFCIFSTGGASWTSTSNFWLVYSKIYDMCTLNGAGGSMFIEISIRRWQWHPTSWQLATSNKVYLVSNSKASTLYTFNTYVRPIEYDCIFYLKSKAFALASWHHYIWIRILTPSMHCSSFQFTTPPNIRRMDTLRVICVGNDRACLMLRDWEIHVAPYTRFVDHPEGFCTLESTMWKCDKFESLVEKRFLYAPVAHDCLRRLVLGSLVAIVSFGETLPPARLAVGISLVLYFQGNTKLLLCY